jgi:hypothetical protein
VRRVATQQGEDVEQPDRARMIVEQAAEIRLAHPAVDVRADLDANDVRHRVRVPIAMRQEHLAEATLPEQALDAVAQLRFRTVHELAGQQQQPAACSRCHDRSRHPRGRRRRGHL